MYIFFKAKKKKKGKMKQPNKKSKLFLNIYNGKKIRGKKIEYIRKKFFNKPKP